MPSFVVLRVRGRVDVRYDIKETLKRLNLHRKFHATIVPDTPSYRGMLFKVKDYVAYGPAKPDLVKELLLRRGRLIGNKPLTEEYIKSKFGVSIEELSKKIADGELTLSDIRLLKPVFRLKPPRGGFKKSTKKHVTAGGELGYREDIDKLIMRML